MNIFRGRIDQLVPRLELRNAIGNHIRIMRDALRSMGYQSDIFAADAAPEAKKECFDFSDYLSRTGAGDCLIFHFSLGETCALAYRELQERTKIIFYHNITPAALLAPGIASFADWGRLQLDFLRDAVAGSITVSHYNAQELLSYGYAQPVVMPIMRDYRTLRSLPTEIKKKSSPSSKRIFFVGRFARHKGQHDLVFLSAFLRREWPDRPVQLILAGQDSRSAYGKYVRNLAKRLDAGLVIFEDPTDLELSQLYSSADLFMSLSDHEGFCVPLVEAMAFQLPIIGHRAGAVPEICGDGAILVNKRDPVELISAASSILFDEKAANNWRAQSAKQFLAFDEAAQRTALIAVLRNFGLWNKK